jgi:hypothetical protein
MKSHIAFGAALLALSVLTAHAGPAGGPAAQPRGQAMQPGARPEKEMRTRREDVRERREEEEVRARERREEADVEAERRREEAQEEVRERREEGAERRGPDDVPPGIRDRANERAVENAREKRPWWRFWGDDGPENP